MDPLRSRKRPPRTIRADFARGFLTLALLPALLQPFLRVDGAHLGVNYGLNRVRFPPVGAGIRAKAVPKEATALKGGVQITVKEATVAIEDAGLQGKFSSPPAQRGTEQLSRERTRGPLASPCGPRSTIAGLLQSSPTRGRRRSVTSAQS